MLKIRNIFEGCIIGGAIGDAFGSAYENQQSIEQNSSVFYPFGKPTVAAKPVWRITDDTQLTLATCEAIIETRQAYPEEIAAKMVHYYKAGKITGIGASTLKALQELAIGGHWSQTGRKGEYAAGNGAAMRIAPLAFVSKKLRRSKIEAVSKITHHNDEAYAGALSVVICIQSVINLMWTGEEDILKIIIEQLPDTRVKDRFIELSKVQQTASVYEIGKQYGSSGYVVESVPLAIFAASKVTSLGFEKMLEELVRVGGDTDTNCSIAGQLAGALVGIEDIPEQLKNQLQVLDAYEWIRNTIDKFISVNNWE